MTAAKPILFKDEMIRAILEGRKTQTRRIVKPQPEEGIQHTPFAPCGVLNGKGHPLVCRFGQRGDRLWVREAHAFVPQTAYRCSTGIYQQINPADNDDACVYRENFDRSRSFPWRPSIHMPRWASRITLEITGVRVEQLHGLSEADAKAEGVEPADCCDAYFHGFSKLWQSINGPGSWDANPWVWVIEFSRVDQEERSA